jgi:hypothetical protein
MPDSRVADLLEDGLAVTPGGRAWFSDLLGERMPAPSRGDAVKSCLDWTERRPHLGGRLGVLLLDELESRQWVRRGPEPRAVRLTEPGERWMAAL